jgi:hypothetical protein
MSIGSRLGLVLWDVQYSVFTDIRSLPITQAKLTGLVGVFGPFSEIENSLDENSPDSLLIR